MTNLQWDSHWILSHGVLSCKRVHCASSCWFVLIMEPRQDAGGVLHVRHYTCCVSCALWMLFAITIIVRLLTSIANQSISSCHALRLWIVRIMQVGCFGATKQGYLQVYMYRLLISVVMFTAIYFWSGVQWSVLGRCGSNMPHTVTPHIVSATAFEILIQFHLTGWPNQHAWPFY